MASLNKVIIAGNLTREPEGKRTAGGTSVCEIGVAINRKYKGNDGQIQEDVTFVDVSLFGQPADFTRDYLHKGDSVLIEGRLRLESWEDRNTGQKRSKLKVVGERIQSLSSRQSSGNAGQVPAAQPQQQAAAPTSPPFPAETFDEVRDSEWSIDEIAF